MDKTLIIGAGPAGITFANTLSTVFNNDNFVLVDMGKAVMDREHDSEKDIACGEGGNGLFSDGKFSFFPAGTNVWKLCYHILQKAYKDMDKCLGKYTTIPEMPKEDEIRDYLFEVINQWKLKKYPTEYIGLDDRKHLIQDITSDIPKKCLLFRHKVISVIREAPYLRNERLYVVTFENLDTGMRHVTTFDRIIFSGGRFFPITVNEIFKRNPIPMIFRRYEFGVRIETSADNEAMIGVGEIKDFLDPKLRRKESDEVEFRTFCWCRNGETVLSEFNAMRTYSGRSDCLPTNLSNFGFLVRITDPDSISFSDFQKVASSKDFNLPLEEALSSDIMVEKYGEKVGGLMKKALISITTEFPQLKSSETKILGPSIEGMGLYPDIDHNLQIKSDSLPNIYCLGDNTGIFRGIIPCMISGYYLARFFNYPLTKNITFVTGNQNKIRETERIIGPLTVRKLDLPEFQGTPEEIARQKCKLAAERVNGPVIVEDTSLCFNALGGMPGPYVKWFLQSTGIEGMVKMLKGFEDKTAYAECVFAYTEGPGKEVHIFPGITNGIIVDPRGETHFGWDPIFQPDGYEYTYAELDNGVKNKISHRHKAIRKLEAYLYSKETTQ